MLMVLIVLPGTIPANTGRMLGVLPTRPALGDHPREYGENMLPVGGGVLDPGPSPRIRGE